MKTYAYISNRSSLRDILVKSAEAEYNTFTAVGTRLGLRKSCALLASGNKKNAPLDSHRLDINEMLFKKPIQHKKLVLRYIKIGP